VVVSGDVGFKVGELEDGRRLGELVHFGADHDLDRFDVLDVFGAPLAGPDVGGDLPGCGEVLLGRGAGFGRNNLCGRGRAVVRGTAVPRQ